jgi:iron complex outermembrane receptor protein
MKAIFTLSLLIAFAFLATAQTVITGKVFDSNSAETLIGATVAVKGTTNGTIVAADGSFSITLTDQFPVVLSISFLGYTSQEIELNDNKPVTVYLQKSSATINDVTVSARRREETLQETPVAISVVGANEINNSVSFNVNRVKELVPSVQLYSSNPRNTTLNIRGLGSTFGLTNDGIDPGVGFYVDGVYYARPAATALDFIDIQQIEVLRGPQGSLFGKNTTAGAFNITSKKPTFNPSGTFEMSFGNYGFIQTKGSISGPLVANKLAARLSFSGTHRNGNIYNVSTEKYTNTLNNIGVRGQLLYLVNEKITLTLAGDFTRQRPDGYAQVYAGTAPTKRAAFRQFENIIADLNYDLPSRNPFDRLIDHDTPWRSDNDFGGASLNADFKIGNGTLTSTTAWRNWKWGPSNDRDFTGLSAIARSEAPSIHNQWSQELRYAGKFGEKLNGVFGLFAYYQKLDADGAHTLEAGSDQWRFVQNNQDTLWQTPGLLDGLTEVTKPSFTNFSGAVFGQLDWKVTEKFIVLPGIRLNYDQKKVDFQRTVTGGLQTTDAALLALQRRVFTPISFQTEADDWNVSGQLSIQYKFHPRVRAYATYALSFKPVGLNLGGIPTNADGPMLELAVIKPERVNHFELGFKSEPFKNAVLNLTGYYTDIHDYQTNVRASELGVARGYLANADRVRVAGAEFDFTYQHPKYFLVRTALSYTDGKYVTFNNAPVPLEETGGGADIKDISGEVLPGISKWALSGGVELFKDGKLLTQKGEFFIGADVYYRSSFSSNPTPSKYLNVEGYALLNARLGFRTAKGITVFVWSRNLANTNYFEQLLPASGDAGHYAGVLGDPRTYGITVRYNFF